VEAEKLKSKHFPKNFIMKKLWLLILVICFVGAPTLKAQLEKGNIMTGVTSTANLWSNYGSSLMNIGFMSTKYNDSDPYKCIHFNFLPRGGYFIMDNVVVGLNLLLGTYTEKSQDGDYKESGTTIGIGPFARYYHPLENIYPFVEVNLKGGTHIDKYKSASWDDTEKWCLFSFGAGGGVAKPLSEKVTLDAMIDYNFLSWKEKGEVDGEGSTEKQSAIGVTVGFTIYLGPKIDF
jgi:hypothetical protein